MFNQMTVTDPQELAKLQVISAIWTQFKRGEETCLADVRKLWDKATFFAEDGNTYIILSVENDFAEFEYHGLVFDNKCDVGKPTGYGSLIANFTHTNYVSVLKKVLHIIETDGVEHHG